MFVTHRCLVTTELPENHTSLKLIKTLVPLGLPLVSRLLPSAHHPQLNRRAPRPQTRSARSMERRWSTGSKDVICLAG